MKNGRRGPPKGGAGGRGKGRGGGRPIRGNSPPGGGPAKSSQAKPSRKGGPAGGGQARFPKGGPGGRNGQAGQAGAFEGGQAKPSWGGGSPGGGQGKSTWTGGPGGSPAGGRGGPRKGPRQGDGQGRSPEAGRGGSGKGSRPGGGSSGQGGQGPKRWSSEGPPRAPKRWNQAPQKPGRAAGPPPSKPELGRLMALYGVRLPPHTLDQLWKYHQFLRANNQDMDLTRLIGFETMAQRHYADCMILHAFMQGKWPSPLVDVGSGAGFPGIMVKLMSPQTRIVLAEPRPRRVDFLERTIKELGLKDISVFPHKVTSKSFTEPMAGTITRAFETVEKSLPRFGGCLGVGGKAIFMKGPKVAEELTDLGNDEYRVVKNHIYRIPNTTLDRALLVMERIKVPAKGEAVSEVEEDEDIPESDESAGETGETGDSGDAGNEEEA